MFAHWLSSRGLDELTDIRQLQIGKGYVLYRATDFLSLAVSTFLVLIPGETSPVSSNFSQTSASY